MADWDYERREHAALLSEPVPLERRPEVMLSVPVGSPASSCVARCRHPGASRNNLLPGTAGGGPSATRKDALKHDVNNGSHEAAVISILDRRIQLAVAENRR